MNPIEWLSRKAPGFSELSAEEREAIMHFSLLWSFFEAEVLNTNASANSILACIHGWDSTDRLRLELFTESLAYFQARYFQNGQLTKHFSDLSLRQNDNPALVGSVLKRENTNHADSVAALLIIVLRLRNNLFHGVKWAYGIHGQLDNFTNANAALIAAMETHGQL